MSRVPDIHLRPVEGRRIRHKDGTLFDADGESVPANSFYLRLLDAGDLEKVPAKKKTRRKSASEGSTSE